MSGDTKMNDNNKKSVNKTISAWRHHEDLQHSHENWQHSNETYHEDLQRSQTKFLHRQAMDSGEGAEADCSNCQKNADASVPGNQAVGIVRGAISNSSKSQAYTSGNSFLDSELKAATCIKQTPMNSEKIGDIMMDDNIANGVLQH